MKTYIEMLADIGRKIYISLKSAVSAVLKEFSKILNNKTYRSKRIFKRGLVPLYYAVWSSRRHCTFFLA